MIEALPLSASQPAAALRIFAKGENAGGATVSTGVGSALGCRWSASLLKMAKNTTANNADYALAA